MKKLTRLSQSQWMDVVRRYQAGEDHVALAKEFGLHDQSVAQYFRTHGISMRPRYPHAAVLKENARKISSRYLAGESSVGLASDFGVSQHTMAIFLKESLGIEMRNRSDCHRKYSLNESVFDWPLSAKARFWVGFLIADGCILDKGKNKNQQISLRLGRKDRVMVEKFQSFLETNSPVKDSVNNFGDPFSFIVVSSAKMADALEKYGVVPRKSKTAKVCDELAFDRDLWRGVCDGDGYLGWTVRGYPSLKMCGSFALMEQFRQFVCFSLPEYSGTVRPHHTIYQIDVNGRNQVFALLNALYGNNPEESLPRKLEIALKIIGDGKSTRKRKADISWVTKDLLIAAIRKEMSLLKSAAYLGISPASFSKLQKKFGISIVEVRKTDRLFLPSGLVPG